MDETFFDPELNEILAVKSLFMSSGWLKYEEKVKTLLTFHVSEIDKLTESEEPLRVEDLPALNFHKAKCSVLRDLLRAKEEMLDEVDPDRELKKEKTDFEVKEKDLIEEFKREERYIHHIATNKKDDNEKMQ